MNVKIGDFALTSDGAHNFTVYQVKQTGEDSKNPGSERRVLVGHYPNLSSACSGILNQRMLQSEAESIEALKRDLADARADILNAMGIRV